MSAQQPGQNHPGLADLCSGTIILLTHDRSELVQNAASEYLCSPLHNGTHGCPLVA